MAELTTLQKVKLLLDITSNDKDNLLNLLISEAEDFQESYTSQTLESIKPITEQIVVYRFNLLGSEGLNSESYSGLSFSYDSALPEHIYKHLNKYRKVIFL